MSIMTVNGPISADEAGIISPHEHILLDLTNEFITPDDSSKKKLAKEKVNISNLDILSRNPFVVMDNLCLDDENTAVEEVTRFRNAGGRTIVDATTAQIGRDPGALQRISNKTGVKIVAGCGYYTQDTHPEDMDSKKAGDIIDEMLTDIEIGIDGTSMKAGVIGEIGTSKEIHEWEKKSLEAAGVVQKKTGLGMHVHTYPWGDRGLPALEILKKNGADLSKIAINHVDVEFDHDYCRHLIIPGRLLNSITSERSFISTAMNGKSLPGDFL